MHALKYGQPFSSTPSFRLVVGEGRRFCVDSAGRNGAAVRQCNETRDPGLTRCWRSTEMVPFLASSATVKPKHKQRNDWDYGCGCGSSQPVVMVAVRVEIR